MSFHSEHSLGCSETKVCKTTDKTQSNSGVSTGDASITSEPGDSDEGRPAVIKVESNTELISMKNVDKYIMKENNKYRCTICGKLGNYKANLKGWTVIIYFVFCVCLCVCVCVCKFASELIILFSRFPFLFMVKLPQLPELYHLSLCLCFSTFACPFW